MSLTVRKILSNGTLPLLYDHIMMPPSFHNFSVSRWNFFLNSTMVSCFSESSSFKCQKTYTSEKEYLLKTEGCVFSSYSTWETYLRDTMGSVPAKYNKAMKQASILQTQYFCWWRVWKSSRINKMWKRQDVSKCYWKNDAIGLAWFKSCHKPSMC